MNASKTLAKDVLAELGGDPRIDATRLTLAVSGGVVALRGRVRSYSEKCCAESIVRELHGVLEVENGIEVRLSVGHFRTDAGLSHLTNEMLQNHAQLDHSTTRATVTDGWILLQGVVACPSQKACAEEIVRELAGVRGITNEIEVVPRFEPTEAKPAFQAALQRRGAISVEDLLIHVSGGTMALHGMVGSCAQRDDLIMLAARTRGISRVASHLTVRPGDGSGRRV